MLSSAVAMLSQTISFKVFNEKKHIFMEYIFNYNVRSKWGSKNSSKKTQHFLKHLCYYIWHSYLYDLTIIIGLHLSDK